ncbi:MAG: DUF4276 family protein [Thermodesulfobacteriota bacterium]|nr:DUF4276 family protein [Thermodesulfobacteriota bacterium]
MHIEFMVEEPSAEAALLNILPKVLEPTTSFAIHPHQGKQDLLRKLPSRFRGYKAWLPKDWRIVVLIDADDEDCRELKARLEDIAYGSHLLTKRVARNSSNFQVLNRLAIEELEAWFFGDIEALNAAYPRISLNLGNKAKYRNPDAITGGTWEALERELKRVGYYAGGFSKISAAREISLCMVPERNRSHSFQIFRQGLLEITGS